MTIPQADYQAWNIKLVKGPLYLFIAVMILGTAFSYFTYDRYLGAQEKNIDLNNRYKQAQRDRRETETLVKKVDDYHSRYTDLQRRGYFQSDAKINWLEIIGEVAQEVGLGSVDYSIGGAVTESSDYNSSSGLLVESIPVTLQIKLLHEVDLLKMLNQFSQRNIGLVGSEGCVIEKTNEGVQGDSISYAFSATCDLKGYVIQFDDRLDV